MQNDAGTQVSDWHKSDTTVSRGVLIYEIENPGALAGATGAKFNEGLGKPPVQNTPKRDASAMSKYGKRVHKRMAKALGYALTLGTPSAWYNFRAILLLSMSDVERAALAYAVLGSLSPDQIDETVDAVILDHCRGRATA